MYFKKAFLHFQNQVVNFNLQEKDYGLHWPAIVIICCFTAYVLGLFITSGVRGFSWLDSVLGLTFVEVAVTPITYLPQVSK